MHDPAYDDALRAAEVLRERLGPHDVALVLGSGWADIVTDLGRERASMPMCEVTGFPPPRVTGHAGQVHSVDCGESRLLVYAGRCHRYEDHPVDKVVHAVRAAVMAGCRTVVLTNAAGALRGDLSPGQAVLLSDQLNLTGDNPMVGAGPPGNLPDRFVDLGDLYSARIRAAVREAVPGVVEGVYAGVVGGSFETPAEVRMIRSFGADLVGMSTVLEAIAAHHLGAEVAGISLVTNLAAGLSPRPLDHQEVLATGRESIPRIAALVSTVIGAAR